MSCFDEALRGFAFVGGKIENPGLTSWIILSRPFGTFPIVIWLPRTDVLGYSQPSPSGTVLISVYRATALAIVGIDAPALPRVCESRVFRRQRSAGAKARIFFSPVRPD
jgi:hypothetical protein